MPATQEVSLNCGLDTVAWIEQGLVNQVVADAIAADDAREVLPGSALPALLEHADRKYTVFVNGAPQEFQEDDVERVKILPEIRITVDAEDLVERLASAVEARSRSEREAFVGVITSLASALEGGWIAPGALIVWEESAEAAPEPPEGLRLLDRRAQGGSQLLILRAEG